MAIVPPRPLALALVLVLASCGGGGSGGSSGVTPGGSTVVTPTPTPSPGASSVPVNAAVYQCPTSDASTSTVARAGGTGDAVRIHRAHHARATQPSAALLAVTYDRTTALRSAASVATHEQSLGGTVVQTLDFAHAGLTTHVISVPAAKASAIAATLRAQTGVKSVGQTGYRRNVAAVTVPYYTSDPYFAGFAAASPATFHVAPYAEAANVPGQWDMHAIGLDHAFAYSQPGNGSSVAVNASALGSAAIKLAIIDTGVDATHPEFSGKVAYQRCFVTSPSGTQSTSAFSADPQGHGTDVAGIAGAASNNGFGFTGAGGLVSLYAYRVFPTPDDTCANDTGSDAQCGSDTLDLAAAINDAVAQHVNVISLSLGGDGCTNGADDDPVEGAAIANALAANIIVVAAAGNDASTPLEAPACDPGVIAAGASALGDGQPNGTSSVGSAGGTVEYVASYSDWGSPAAAPKSSAAWGIVAPGGDPSSDTDADDLHWIENTWTTKPFDTTFAGECENDYPNSTLTTNPDCRALIAGTSMSTPHVAGAAALILAVNATYQTPAMMKALLCSTADDIGDPHQGCGRLNVYRAMATALQDPVLP